MKIFSILSIIILLSGCNLIGTKVTICTQENDQSKSGYNFSSTYKIYSKKDIVKKEDNKLITNVTTDYTKLDMT